MKVILLLCLAIVAVSAVRNSFAFSPNRVSRAFALENAEPSDNARWFEQELDHFSPQDQGTWKQRYFVNETYYKAGGPFFINVGGEGAISEKEVTGHLMMSSYAQTYGAMVVSVEHRFYGESQPFPDLSTDNLRLLSSQQALADLANFIVHLKEQYGAPDAPVITFGGSYPGALAAWFRMKYPHVTMGSIASSAPVFAALDFYGYMDVVDKSLASVSGEICDRRIQIATAYVDKLVQTEEGRDTLAAAFNICRPLVSDKDISTMYANLMGNFQGVVQYDEEGSPITIQTVCDIMESGSDRDAFENYQKVNALVNGKNCIECNYDATIDLLKQTDHKAAGVGMRQWTYQTCLEFGYFQTTDSENQPFGDNVPLSYYTDMCHDTFGFTFKPRVNETNLYYGGRNPRGASNIDFVNGSIDPWHALSITEDFSQTVIATFVQGTAHCDDMLPPKNGTTPRGAESDCGCVRLDDSDKYVVESALAYFENNSGHESLQRMSIMLGSA
ncbi:hypothetical protein PROFUN_03124 [Planoprotostelium fungivorum]|uniref:Uncharacterized protein n=1 Tax=Planoprotostelium fungivorum TaxID=1890364 RepID=A0A2P6NQA4_9EUKA|nr:hypothetical protein PROFUN_03124 [Planoprotostelium fungivorum]